MDPVYTMKGVGDLLEVYDDKLTITPKGVLGFMTKGVKGTKTIPFLSISAIQLKKSGLTSGYLQFTIPGGNESRRGLFDAASDENTFMFAGNNDQAVQIKEYIENRIYQLRVGNQPDKEQKINQLIVEHYPVSLRSELIYHQKVFLPTKNLSLPKNACWGK